MTRRSEDTAPAPAVSSIGEQLRAARVARSWSVQYAAGRLRLRSTLIEALEGNDYVPFGAAAYARGQLRNYARLLGLDEQALLQDFRPAAGTERGKPLRRAPELHPGRPWLVRVGGLAIIGTLVVLGALWAGAARDPQTPTATATPTELAATPHSVVPPSDAPAITPATLPIEPAAAPEPIPMATETLPPASGPPPAASAPTTVGSPAQDVPHAGANAPTANPAPPAAPQSATATPNSTGELRLNSRAVSWVEVTDRNGQRLVYDLVSPGAQRTVRGEPPLHVLLGNAPAVDVLYNGAPVTLPADQHVVRMTLGTAPPQSAPVSESAPASSPAAPAPTP